MDQDRSPVETSVLATSLLTASVGEQLDTNYTVHELPCPGSHVCESHSTSNLSDDSIDYVVNAELLSKIELLEAENRYLKVTSCKVSQQFRIEQIQSNDHLFCYYTGFISYSVFIAFFKCLGRVVYELEYWNIGALNGSNESDVHVNWILSTSYS